MLVCNVLIFFFYLLTGEPSFLQTLVAPKYWEALEQSKALALNETGYSKNTFSSFN